MDLLKKEIYPKIGRYRHSNNYLALWNISITFFFILLTYKLEFINKTLIFLPFIILLRALLYVRTFIITHDLGHNSYFTTKLLNTFFGFFIAGYIGVCFKKWKENHDFHHKTSNDLYYEQLSQTAPLTVSEFRQLSEFSKKIYLFNYSINGLMTTMPILFIYRNILNCIKNDRKSLSVLIFSIFIRKQLSINFYLEVLSIFISIVIGVLMFHIQHTFEGTKREFNKCRFENGLKDSTFLQIPRFFKFFAHGIEYHHIHHLNSGIPAYYLKKCHEELEKDSPLIWKYVNRVHLQDMLTVELVLYDIYKEKMLKIQEIPNFNNKIKQQFIN